MIHYTADGAHTLGELTHLATKANSKLRICLDPKDLNKAIICENHKAPTLEEITHVLTTATRLSKVDRNKAFHRMHLSHDASLLTMFNTHLGRFRGLCGTFGLQMSEDIFQMGDGQDHCTLPWSTGYLWQCVHLWQGKWRSWYQPTELVQCGPERTHIQQFQVCHQARISDTHGVHITSCTIQ